MRKGFFGLFLIPLLVGGIYQPVHAETYHGDSGWQVAFTSGDQMESNFRTADLDDAVSGLQPGDNIIFTLSLQNQNSVTTDWWMTNEVLHSLEDSSANSSTHGGAYTYVLTYTDKNGAATTLFSSETIGGDTISSAGEGLHAATDALEEYFYLDTLASGQGGVITLEVALDGETQGNDYQDTLADLQMNFAVELNPDGSPLYGLDRMSQDFTLRRGRNGQYELVDLDETLIPLSVRNTDVVRTGDETNLKPYFIAMTISGVLILLLAFYSLRQSRKEKREAE